MTSEVDISNLALGFLGDPGAVTSISPPDPSVQASLCARYYPLARDTLLSMHSWNFSTTRSILAQLSDNPSSTWAFAFGLPSDYVTTLSVLPVGATNDYSDVANDLTGGVYTPLPYTIEVDANGNKLLLSTQDAQGGVVLRYTRRVTDAALFPALFVNAVAMLLSSYLAGPLIRGVEGAKTTAGQMQIFMAWKQQAVAQDANERQVEVTQATPLAGNH